MILISLMMAIPSPSVGSVGEMMQDMDAFYNKMRREAESVMISRNADSP
jgi:hypothetical protein